MFNLISLCLSSNGQGWGELMKNDEDPSWLFFRKFEFWHLSTSFRMRCARLFRKSRSYTADASSLSNMSGKTSQTVFKKSFGERRRVKLTTVHFYCISSWDVSTNEKLLRKSCWRRKRKRKADHQSQRLFRTSSPYTTGMSHLHAMRGVSLSPLRRRFLKVGRKVLKNTEEAKKQVSVELETSWLVGKGKEVLWL